MKLLAELYLLSEEIFKSVLFSTLHFDWFIQIFSCFATDVGIITSYLSVIQVKGITASDAERTSTSSRKVLATVIYGISKTTISWQLLILEVWCIAQKILILLYNRYPWGTSPAYPPRFLTVYFSNSSEVYTEHEHCLQNCYKNIIAVLGPPLLLELRDAKLKCVE